MYQPDLAPLSGHRWRIIAACAACAVAGIAAGILLPQPPAQAPATRTAPVRTSSPAIIATPRATLMPSGSIYRQLPVTARQLSTAVGLAARFTTAYCTYSSTQPPAAWLARLRPDTTTTLQATLAQAAADPALLQLRTRQHAEATCVPAATAIRDIASTSVTVVVTTRQAIRAGNQTRTAPASYVITVAPYGGRWKVYDIESANAGQAGEGSP
jgi:hypothetical protein